MSDSDDAMIARNQDPLEPDSEQPLSLVLRILGVSKEAVAALNYRTVRASDLADLDKECSVCLGPLQVGDVLKTMPCKHEFHEQCLNRWLQEAPSCPLCRFQLESNDISNPIIRNVVIDILRRHNRHRRRFQDFLNQINGSIQDGSNHRRHERSRLFGPYHRSQGGTSNRRSQDDSNRNSLLAASATSNRRRQERSNRRRQERSNRRSQERSNRREN